MKKQKILLINKSLVIGGIETILATQYNSLKENGHTVDIFLFKNIIETHIKDKTHIFFKNNNSSLSTFIQSKEMERKYDLIICHAQSERICKEVKSLKKASTIFVIHGMQSKKLIHGNFIARYLRKKRKKLLYKNQSLITVSEAVKKDIESMNIKAKIIKVIYNPFDIKHIKNLSLSLIEEKFHKPYVIWVGRISDVKNLPLLLKIYKNLSTQYDLVIVGNGNEAIKNDLLKMIENWKLKENVHFVGFKSNPYPYIHQASALLITSKNEGLPTVIIESLLLNTPVFGVDIPAIKELLFNYYQVGLLSGDSEEMSKQILKNIHNLIDIEKITKELSFNISNKHYLDYFIQTQQQ